jgi:hypothetical protein
LPLPDRERYAYVYHPSVVHKSRGEASQEIAQKAKTPSSKFILGTVDSVTDENEDFKPWHENCARNGNLEGR